MTDHITRRAPAKINLTLDVGARRTDGYHEIRSVMQTVALHDTLTVTQTSEFIGVRVEVSGEEAAGVPTDQTNLAFRAATRILSIASSFIASRGLHLHLCKRIPTQAGMGGGSSDAAAALHSVNTLLGIGLSAQQLTEIGAELGADVPFFLTGGTALAEGLGERVTPLPPLLPAWDLVIAQPPAGISTAHAYAALDAQAERIPGQATAAWLRNPQTALSNDFQRIAQESVPEVATLLSILAAAPERMPDWPPLLCGSGSAVFCRVRDAAAGDALAARLSDQQAGRVWVTQTTEGSF